MHRKKVQTTTARVDNNLPNSYKYPIVKSKKEMIIEDRCNEIEKANRILLQRMTSILAGPATHMINSQPKRVGVRAISVGRKRGGTAVPATSANVGRSVLVAEMAEAKAARDEANRHIAKQDRSNSP